MLDPLRTRIEARAVVVEGQQDATAEGVSAQREGQFFNTAAPERGAERLMQNSIDL
jgi:hypothetical protein